MTEGLVQHNNDLLIYATDYRIISLYAVRVYAYFDLPNLLALHSSAGPDWAPVPPHASAGIRQPHSLYTDYPLRDLRAAIFPASERDSIRKIAIYNLHLPKEKSVIVSITIEPSTVLEQMKDATEEDLVLSVPTQTYHPKYDGNRLGAFLYARREATGFVSMFRGLDVDGSDDAGEPTTSLWRQIDLGESAGYEFELRSDMHDVEWCEESGLLAVAHDFSYVAVYQY